MIRYIDQEMNNMFNSSLLHPQVFMLSLLASACSMHRFGKNLWVTSVFRQGDKGVHGHWRGVDLDNDEITIDNKILLADHLNKLFIYDPNRPELKVCLYHKVEGRGGDHFHLQVHPNTQLR